VADAPVELARLVGVAAEACDRLATGGVWLVEGAPRA
jgi:hypothetical protein